MKRRFIIFELENGQFLLKDKLENVSLLETKDFDTIMSHAMRIAKGGIVWGITHIKLPEKRHPAFKNFKTPIRCSYELKK